MSVKEAIIYPRVRESITHTHLYIKQYKVIKIIIYKVINKENGKIYIGQTINTLEYRKAQHWRDAKSNKRENTYFHNALKKYGIDSFDFKEIETANSMDALNERERFWILYYNSNNKNKGYNLDSGGKNGGKKSASTRRKIGNTTIIKWEDSSTRLKMLKGLRKGTETVKQQAKTNFVEWVCPICKEVTKLKPYEATQKKYCSLKCASRSEDNLMLLKEISSKKKKDNIIKKQIVKEFIINWCKINSEIINTCPLNKIVSHLEPLLSELAKRFEISDIRSYFICFGVKNKKEFLKELKMCVYR